MALVAGDIRTRIIPNADLDLQGESGEPLQLGKDVEVELAIISLVNAIRPRAAQAGNNGGLLVSRQADSLGMVGSQGNVFNGGLTGIATNGFIIDLLDLPFVTMIATVDAACTVTLMESADGVTFVAGPTIVFAGAGSNLLNVTVGARFATAQSTVSVHATISIQAKG